jgi:hypothetical protein
MEEIKMVDFDTTKLREEIERHDAFCAMIWGKLLNATTGMAYEISEGMFAAMDASAKRVGIAFWEATKDRNCVENCLIGCGRSNNKEVWRDVVMNGQPGSIPEFFRQIAGEGDV